MRESELIVFITPQIITTDYYGNEREQVAHQVGQQALDKIPIAKPKFCPPYQHDSTDVIAPHNQLPSQPSGSRFPEEVKPRTNDIPLPSAIEPISLDHRLNHQPFRQPYYKNSPIRMERLPPITSPSRKIRPVPNVDTSHYPEEMSQPTARITNVSAAVMVGHTQDQSQPTSASYIPNSSINKGKQGRLERFPPLPDSFQRKSPWVNELFKR